MVKQNIMDVGVWLPFNKWITVGKLSELTPFVKRGEKI